MIAAPLAPPRLAVWLATAGCIVVALAFLTHWPVYQATVQGRAIFGQAYVLPIVAAAALIAVYPGVLAKLFREAIFWWFVAYVVLGFVWLSLMDPGDTAQQQWRLRVLALLHFSSIFLLASVARRGPVVAIIAACMLFGGLCNYLDVIFPYRFMPRGFEGATPERGAGFFMNANIAAAFVVLSTFTAVALAPVRYRAVLLVAGIVAVAPCFSRFGFVFAALIVGAAIVMGLLRRAQVIVLLLAIPLLVAGAGLYYDFLMSAQEVNVSNIQDRLAWFTNPSEAGDDESVAGRAEAAERAWNMFADDPLFGHGIGATSHAIQVLGTHNMYLMLMAEQGIFGLFLYLSLILLLAQRGWALLRTRGAPSVHDVGAALVVCALFFAAYGLSSHNVLEEEYGLFLLAFLVASARRASEEIEVPERSATGRESVMRAAVQR